MGDEYEVMPVSFSDHCLVYFTLGSIPKHSGFNFELWKFNDKLLEDDCFLIGVNGLLEKLLAKSNTFIAPWGEFESEVKMLAKEKRKRA